MISSLDNPKIKELVKLRDAKYRREKKLFIIEGIKEISLAVGVKSKLRINIQEAYFCPAVCSSEDLKSVKDLIAQLTQQGVSVEEVDEKVYLKIAFGERKEGIIVKAIQPESTFSDLKTKDNSLIIVLESLEKPGNLGAVARSVDACGADALIIASPLCDIYNPNAIRASIGTLFSVPLASADSRVVIDWLKANKIKIVCALPEAKKIYTEVNFKESVAVIFGSEEKGLSSLWRENADLLISIPMKGSADSLNVSTSAAVICFEAMRQRKE